jgi:hypothetical protein
MYCCCCLSVPGASGVHPSSSVGSGLDDMQPPPGVSWKKSKAKKKQVCFVCVDIRCVDIQCVDIRGGASLVCRTFMQVDPSGSLPACIVCVCSCICVSGCIFCVCHYCCATVSLLSLCR